MTPYVAPIVMLLAVIGQTAAVTDEQSQCLSEAVDLTFAAGVVIPKNVGAFVAELGNKLLDNPKSEEVPIIDQDAKTRQDCALIIKITNEVLSKHKCADGSTAFDVAALIPGLEEPEGEAFATSYPRVTELLESYVLCSLYDYSIESLV